MLTEEQAIQRWVVGMIRRTIKCRGLDKAKELFDTLRVNCDDQDEWPAIARKVKALFASEEKKQQKLADQREQQAKAIVRNISINGANPTYTETNQ